MFMRLTESEFYRLATKYQAPSIQALQERFRRAEKERDSKDCSEFSKEEADTNDDGTKYNSNTHRCRLFR